MFDNNEETTPSAEGTNENESKSELESSSDSEESSGEIQPDEQIELVVEEPKINSLKPNPFDEAAATGFFSVKLPVSSTKVVTLPNQKVGEPFSIVLKELQGSKNIQWEGIPDGVSFNTETNELAGSPEKDGQYKIRYICSDDLSKVDLYEYGLVVIPDPKTLWKNIPTDKNAQFWKADLASEIDSTQNLYVVAASNRGRSHAHEGKFREDDYAVMCIGPSTWSVFAVADGGGSYKYSRRGSEIAVKQATKKLASLLEQHLSPLLDGYTKPVENIHEDQEVNVALYNSLIKSSFDAAVAIEEEADRFGAPAKEFSTTLLLVAVKRFAIGHVVVGFNIGDGASGVIYGDKQELYLLCVPESGEFAGQTRFLSKSEFKEENSQASRLRITVVPKFDAIAIMSDGVSDAKFPNDNSLHDVKYWNNLIFDDWKTAVLGLSQIDEKEFPSDNAETKNLANAWLDYWVPGTHDDRTLIVAFSKDAH
jgi:serine/threonine protein phosphatase PrpC